MADWNLPASLATFYEDVLNFLKARDVDSGTLFSNAPTNPVVGMIRYNRGNNTFEEWNGTAWVIKIISLAGGGTGAQNPAGVISSLGLGTMAMQNANNVTITGGTLAASGAGITNMNAGALASGIVPLPRIVGLTTTQFGSPNVSQWVNDSGYLTSASGLNASNLTTGTVPDGRFPTNLPNHVNVKGEQITSGLINVLRLGTGSPDSTKFLRGDGTWAVMGGVKQVQWLEYHYSALAGTPSGNGFIELPYPIPLTGPRAVIIPQPPYTSLQLEGIPGMKTGYTTLSLGGAWEHLNATTVRLRLATINIPPGPEAITIVYTAYVVEYF